MVGPELATARRLAAELVADHGAPLPTRVVLAAAEAHYGPPPPGCYEQLAYWDAVGSLAADIVLAAE